MGLHLWKTCPSFSLLIKSLCATLSLIKVNVLWNDVSYNDICLSCLLLSFLVTQICHVLLNIGLKDTRLAAVWYISNYLIGRSL